MDTCEIREGETRLLVPSEREISKKDVVFYNPEMEFSRNLSVYVARVLKPRRFCDLLAGSGAKGLRVANEAGVGDVLLNDRNPQAFELIGRNARINGLSPEVTNRDANSLLGEERFDFIDVDPFGPPVSFIDSAVRALEHGGVLAVTATDTSALCGSYPKACMRKYGSASLRTDYYNELGLRILLGYVVRSGLRYGFSFKPLFSHCTRHYFRVYLRGLRSSSRCNKSLGNLGFIQHCFGCLNRRYSDLDGLRKECDCGGRFMNAGPLWSGDFADAAFCRRLLDECGSDEDAAKLISGVMEEQGINNPYYNIHKVFQKKGLPSQSMKEVTSALEAGGFRVCRTHFSGLGLRTDASVFQINELL